MKNFLCFISSLFRTPTALQIAKHDLAEGQRRLLKHKDAAEYHAQMVVYHTMTNDRLAVFVRVNTPAPAPSPMQELITAKVNSRRAPKLVEATA